MSNKLNMDTSELTVTQRVIKIVAQVVERPVESLDLDAHMITDLGLDSLLALEILALMEKEFHIEIPEEELAHFQRVRQIIEVAERRLAERQVAE